MDFSNADFSDVFDRSGAGVGDVRNLSEMGEGDVLTRSLAEGEARVLGESRDVEVVEDRDEYERDGVSLMELIDGVKFELLVRLLTVY